MTDKIRDYFNKQRSRKVAFVGLGRSNLPLIEMFCKAGADVYACDSRSYDALGENAALCERYGAKLSLGKGYLDNVDVDVLFRTPGMNYNSPILSSLRQKGVEITSEMELFFELCPCKIIAITGSDGKTTTTTIVSELLKKQGYTVHLGGNIGFPLMPRIESIAPDDFAVVELSSFQLISMKESPYIAAVTNITPNHLDVHKDMDEYIEAKKNIISYQNADSIAVLNCDNAITASFAEEVRGEVRFFSMNTKVSRGAYVKNEKIWYTDGINDTEILALSDIALPGMHNVANYMTAISVVKDLVSVDTINAVAREFCGVKHRAQLVRTLNGVKYYNDSIASSPTRTASGMLSLFDEKIILICGGYDKKIPYDSLGPVICRKVKILILLGATSSKIETAVINSPEYKADEIDIYRVDSMEEAVKLAHSLAVCGDIVALSPASASFDLYRDFEERGEHFMSIVKALQ